MIPKPHKRRVTFFIKIWLGIIKLPEDWLEQNKEVVSFRYEHPKRGQKNEEFYFKFIPAGNKLEINALSSEKNNEIFSTEFE